MPRPADQPDQPARQRPTGCRVAPNVRLAVGLAHAIPGAELTICRADGGRLVAAHRPDADLSLCGLRRLVMGGAGPSIADRWIEVVGLGGSLTATNDGLWSTGWPESKRWFATVLHQDRVIAVLSELHTSDIGEEGIEVVLKPDPGLGITVVGVSTDDHRLSERRNELARRAHAACMVDELIRSADAAVFQADKAVGHRPVADADDATKGER